VQAETIYDEDSDGGGDADDDIEDKDLEPQQAPAPGGEPEKREAQAQTDGHTDGNVRTPLEMLSFLHGINGFADACSLQDSNAKKKPRQN
jgi:hypothetical protein